MNTPNDSVNVSINSIEEAFNRIKDYIVYTPIIICDGIAFKLENHQKTGSFKERGSLNKILVEKEKGNRKVITASTGNHALGVANALSIAKMQGKIVLPKTASKSKIEKLKKFDVALIFVEGSSLQAELHGKKLSEELGDVWISPYNDLEIIAGQGTIGLELSSQYPSVNIVCITVGGGGLISGIGSVLKEKNPNIQIIGCQPVNSAEMHESIKKGQITDVPYQPTLSDGSAGGIEKDAITFPLCQGLIDDFQLISEEEIKDSIRWMYQKTGERIEGAAAVSVAAARKIKRSNPSQKVLSLICGGNIDESIFKSIIEENEHH